MSHITHPVKAETVVTVNFSDSRQTEIHAAGCAHKFKGNRVSEPMTGEAIPGPHDPYTDDWYTTAPCARKRA